MKLDNSKWEHPQEPGIPPEILKQIEEVGGTIPAGCGEFSGLPLFKLQFAGTAQKFANGKMRLRYPARSRRIKRYYGVHKHLFTAIKDYLTAFDKMQKDAFMRLDLVTAFSTPEITPLITNGNFINELDYVRLDSGRPLTELQKVCQLRNFEFVADVPVFEQIGKPFYYLSRYMPSPQLRDAACPYLPTMLDTPRQWADQRFSEGFYPETGEWKMLDRLGEYPSFGGYFHDFVALSNEKGEPIPLNEENVIAPIRFWKRAFEEISERYIQDKELRARVSLQEMLDEYDRETLAWENEWDERFWDATPAFLDAAVSKPIKSAEPLIKVVKN